MNKKINFRKKAAKQGWNRSFAPRIIKGKMTNPIGFN